jgi:hypothetical protein
MRYVLRAMVEDRMGAGLFEVDELNLEVIELQSKS